MHTSAHMDKYKHRFEHTPTHTLINADIDTDMHTHAHHTQAPTNTSTDMLTIDLLTCRYTQTWMCICTYRIHMHTQVSTSTHPGKTWEQEEELLT